MSGAVRVRFAPSPTGHLHVGGARTALFNWLYARHHRGTFILRIEDTDRSRSTDENITAILEALEWLGLDWDEGPPTPGYRQTERLPIYRDHAERLRATGRAYYCDCPPELLERERRAAQARKETFRYSGRCRDRGLDTGALRLRLPDRGATSVQAFRDAGIPADAMVNYLARLGWSHGDQEIFTREELIELFDIKDVASSGAVFDHAKLEWLSHQHIKRMDASRLAEAVRPFFPAVGLEPPGDHAYVARALETLKERGKTFRELLHVGRFYFERPSGYAPEAAEMYFTEAGAARLAAITRRLEMLPSVTPEALESLYRELGEALGLKLVDLAQLTRLALTGGTASPPLFEVLAVLGREEALARLRAAQAWIATTARP